MKLTKNRQTILDKIKNSDAPINIKSINEDIKIDLSTVYRGVNFLEKEHLINSVNFHGETYYFSDHNGHFLFCNSCNSIYKFDNCFVNDVKNLENKYNVKLDSHILIFKGYCENCS